MAEGFVGLAFSVSGVFTLVKQCLSLYRHIDEAGGFGENVWEQYVLFQHEILRFNSWQKEMQDFQASNSTHAATASLARSEGPKADELLNNTLAQIITTLQSVQRLCEKYKVDQMERAKRGSGNMDVPSITTGVATTMIGSAVASDGKLAAASMRKQQNESFLTGHTSLFKRVLYGSRLWKDSDKEELQQLVANFAHWNNCLENFLPSTRKMLLDLSSSSALLESEFDPSSLQKIHAAASTGLYESLARRAKMREMNLFSIHEPSLKKESKCLDEEDINRILLAQRGVATFSDHNREPVKCLIEWKSYADLADYDKILAAEKQVESLVRLLNFNKKPATMNVLESLGYFQYENQEHRLFGFISVIPPKSNINKVPVSLNDLLVDSLKQTRLYPLPSLPQRVRIAQKLAITLLELHNTEWLHKDLNSRNILFFYENQAKPDLDTPWISGFEYARPDDVSAVSFSVRASSMNMYRHPSLLGPFAPGQSRPRFQRLHDVYSLGILLLEIGLWRQIGDFRKASVKPRDFTVILKQLANRELPHRMGSVYCDVVLRCIDADSFAEDSEKGRNTSLVHFYWTVVRELERCHCK